MRDLFPAASSQQQLDLAQQYDQASLFETALFSAVIKGGQATPLTPSSPQGACTVEMTCYCKVDADCQYQHVRGLPALSCKALRRFLPNNKAIMSCLP